MYHSGDVGRCYGFSVWCGGGLVITGLGSVTHFEFAAEPHYLNELWQWSDLGWDFLRGSERTEPQIETPRRSTAGPLEFRAGKRVYFLLPGLSCCLGFSGVCFAVWVGACFLGFAVWAPPNQPKNKTRRRPNSKKRTRPRFPPSLHGRI